MRGASEVLVPVLRARHHHAARPGISSAARRNALHTLLRAVETLFSLWLEFMRQHLSTAVALVLLVPTAHVAWICACRWCCWCSASLYVGIGRVVMRKTKDGQAAVERHYHKVFSHVTDSVSNVAVLQSYNRIGA